MKELRTKEQEDETQFFVSVTLQADSTDIMPRKFTRFLISAEPEKEDDAAESGIFDLQDELLTTYSESCPNAVVETSKMSKEEISVAWTSPSEGSGCIFIRWRDILITSMENDNVFLHANSNEFNHIDKFVSISSRRLRIL